MLWICTSMQIGELDAQLKRALNDLEGCEGRCMKLEAELGELRRDHTRACDRAKLLEEQLAQALKDGRKKDATIAELQHELVRAAGPRCANILQS